MTASKNRKRVRLILIILIILTVLTGIIATIYKTNLYHASPTAALSLESNNHVTVTTQKDGTIIFAPEEAVCGLIFYQGGLVENTAYAPLLFELAQNKILCVMPKMPANLAVFGVSKADGIQESYPDITSWYIGGHSLGGAMAASYVEKHPDTYDGLILLAAYSTADLSSTKLSVLSIYGSNDQVLDKTSYEENRSNLPSNTTEYIIDGGCHAYFGDYGNQKGDGTATISRKEQLTTSVDYITYWMSPAE